ncbi:MAG: glycosyltransferase family 2 protein [Bacteroidales bacterium]|jgi:glycosyltransferase involved in cell wall biosynthesis|nr:glycosyltransferase family 2 protein [Bacteroidales bacterium]
MTNKISAVIITFNEERNIATCIQSLQEVADEIIVVDSGSTDKTEEICKHLGAKFIVRQWDNFSSQKNYANSLASFDYILSIDADELLSTKLRNSILIEKQHLNYEAYHFNRLTYFLGKPIKHCGWYPDKKVRLFNKNTSYWKGDVHETLVLSQTPVFLSGDLLHYTTDNLFSQIEKVNKYSETYALEAVAKGKKVFLLKLIFKPLFKFCSVYFLKLGFIDGWNGFLISCLTSFDTFLRLCKMRILTKKKQTI